MASGGKCFYCERPIYRFKHIVGQKWHPQTFTVDHILPKSKGGEDTLQNCVAACMDCNNRKASSFLEADKKVLSSKS